MKLLLDMGLSPKTARLLRQHGHDAVHLLERGLQRTPDPEVAALGAAEERVIVTLDLDFSRILALQRLASPSVILFRLEEFTTEQVNDLLLDLIHTHEGELGEGAIVVVEPDRVRVRRLPIW